MRLRARNQPERVFFALAAAAEAKDKYPKSHPKRVANTAVQLGMRLGLHESDLLALYRGGLTHDIGKIFVSDAILHKAGPLNALEGRQMREHAAIGERIIKRLPSTATFSPSFVITMSDSMAGATRTGCPGTRFLCWPGLCRSATLMTRCRATGPTGLVGIKPMRSRL